MSMYFSLIEPTPGFERQAARVWHSAYEEHQWLWRFFPAQAGAPRDFLFRRRDSDGLPKFYVVSQRAPTVDSVPDGWQVQTRDYRPSLEAGERLHFDLRANPVVTRTADGKRQRHDVVMERKKRLLAERGLKRWDDWQPDRLTSEGVPDTRPALYSLVQETGVAWLAERAARHGFKLNVPTVVVEAYEQHGGKAGVLRFSSVDFSGELTVTDPAAFHQALQKGIGHAKAFGCGLLLVRRA